MKKIAIFISFILAVSAAACQTPESGSQPDAAAPDASPTEAERLSLRPTPTVEVAVTDLELPGRLIIARGTGGIVNYDLPSGVVETFFYPTPEGTTLYGVVAAAAPSPDGTLLAMAYAPPPPEGEIQFGYTGLYVMPADASADPEILLAGNNEQFFFGPTWSPDGSAIYYARFRSPQVGAESKSGVTLERIAYPGGTPEVLLEDAMWPVLSPDGTRMAYVNIDVDTQLDELFVADADGGNPQRLMEQGTFTAVDAPRFSRDGESILFSAVLPASQTSRIPRWLLALTGTQVAYAHDVPSDLWIVSAGGGTPTQLTDIGAIGIQSDFSPDGDMIIMATSEGVWAMKPDGSDLTYLAGLNFASSLYWVAG